MSSQASATVLTRCQHFSVYLLKYRLNLDVIVYAICHCHFGFQITQVVMYLNDEASSSAHYGVVYIENTFTSTSRRGVA